MTNIRVIGNELTQRLYKAGQLLLGKEGIFYINGPESLPPPLSGQEEAEVFERINAGSSRSP